MGPISREMLVSVCVLMLSACSPLPLSQAVVQFSSALNQAPAASQISLSSLQQLDPLLLRPASLYPQLADTPLPVLTTLYHYHQRCSGSLDGVPAVFRQFEQALCQNTPLPTRWFAAHPVSPLGGSSAWYYLQRHPEDAVTLEPLLHVRERPGALGGVGQLSDDNLEALANGQTWLLQDGDLWRQHQQQWLRYAPQVWQPLAQEAGITLVTAGRQCDISLGTLCVTPLNRYASWWRSLLGIATLMTALALVWGTWQRRRLRQRQRFIVQMLTHELRTPIAQLGNVVEHFRRDFDDLPPRAQSGFGALADSVQRMRQMAEASQHYLSGDGSRDVLEMPQMVWLSEWLEHIAQPYPGLTYCLDADRQVALPLYWTSLCLNNLLDNAFRHGHAPVRLSAGWHQGKLSLRVTDGGQFVAGSLSSPQAGMGMGLGLTIVQRVMRRLNGRLTRSGPPTTFTLELPCDSQK